ncbi:PHD finger protein MALE MEIOCYTE DEATH 1 [Eucalyptus grandis]|uniref:PHD finger protein MALE MEIOCYTE DEATH 1 n=1 Tax=Eucalyptus grandis TaxID=71139 RepID=UPI00192EF1F2|nr:PHD finger protein MALE MEIOCYTE DEATH 1 [Eucalyptus grandis]
MSLPFLQACGKRKRRPKIFNFGDFCDPGCPIRPAGPFRDNICLFLEECGVPGEPAASDLPVWCTLLMHQKTGVVVPLYTVQETMTPSSPSFCDHCRFAGWGNHYMSGRRYHLIIPKDGCWSRPLEECDLDEPNHLLHGLIHGNGFGHLICINGIEGGSKFLCGREIMDLWDRICNNLLVRKVTVEDVSRKQSMDLRLLYGVAYGHTWFGRWSYRFLRGSFGVKEHHYHQAMEFLGSLELVKVLEDFSGTEHFKEIKQIICHYKGMSKTNLVTIKDLLKYMLTVKSHSTRKSKPAIPAGPLPSLKWKLLTRASLQNKHLSQMKPIKFRKFTSAVAEMDSRWPARRMEQAAEVIVNALLEARGKKLGCTGMTRQDVRDAARLHIGDTGLIDNVLKILNNVIVGDYVVRRAVNPLTRILEYTIHEFDGGREPPEQLVKETLLSPSLAVGHDVYKDMARVYSAVFLNHPTSDCVGSAAQVLLDSKHFMKEWPFQDEEDQLLTFICNLIPSIDRLETLPRKKVPPGEIIMVPLHATVGDLKAAAESAFRETYCAFEHLVVTDIEAVKETEDTEVLFGIMESGQEVWVRGTGMDVDSQLRYEGGSENWEVRCMCGAEDDDGERMVACDLCEVWQHTRCCGIDDTDNVPPLFVCSACCKSLAQSRQEDSPLEFRYSGELELFGCLLPPPTREPEYDMGIQC